MTVVHLMNTSFLVNILQLHNVPVCLSVWYIVVYVDCFEQNTVDSRYLELTYLE